MILWGSLAGGLIGTIVLTSGLRISQETGWSRMDLPLLLGTLFTQDRSRASVIGYAVGRAGWDIGLVLGAAHGLFAGGALVTVLLPAIHPHMGTHWTDAEETPILEPPGFLLHNYGYATAALTFVLHLAYGTIVGAFAAGF